MTKVLSVTLFVLTLFVVGMTNAQAQTFTVGNLNYSINSDGVSVTVTGHVDGTAATGELVIPESVEYYGSTFPVTMIGYNAFAGSTEITSLDIGSFVQTIGTQAFYYCIGITSVVFPNSVTEIYSAAFGATGLTSVIIPSNVSYIEGGAFGWCYSLTSIIYDATNCIVGSDWLESCTSLMSITLGENVEIIPAGFLSGLSSITGQITIPNNVTAIGADAFNGCSGFSGSLTIPNAVTTIGANAFSGCSGLSGTLTLGQSLTEIGNSAFFGACEGFTSFNVLAEEPPTLGTNVFTSVDYGISVSVPCGTLDAYQNADGWSSFTNMQESNPCLWDITATAAPAQGGSISGTGIYEQGSTCTLTATAYGDYEFSFWTENGVTVSTNATYSFVVEGNRSLVARFTNPNFIAFADPNVEAICVNNWDTDGDGFLSYEEAAAVTNLGNAFQNNQAITSFDELQYFTGLTQINDYEFWQCNNLASVAIPTGVTYIGEGAFGYNSLTSLNYYATNCSVSSYWLYECYSLSNLTIGDNVQVIPDNFVPGQSNLVGELVIPAPVTYIGSSAFANCTGLTGTLTLPENVATIGGSAFANCTGFIGDLTLGTAVTSVGQYAFQDCIGLTGIIFNATNCTGLGYYYNREYDFAANYGNGEYYTDDPYCYFISAFSGCSNITMLQIGEGVQTIPNGAFRDLTGITGSFNLPNSVVTIGDYAFAETNLSGVLTIPENVTSVGLKAFAHTGITAINFNAENCTKMGYYYLLNAGYNDLKYISAFYECSEIESIQIGENVHQIPNGAFKDLQGLSVIGNLTNSIETIGDYAFDNIGISGTLTIPSSVTSIGSYSFSSNLMATIEFNATNCTSMGNGWFWVDGQDIAVSTFYNCNNLTTLIIGEQVESIPAYAFVNCATLTDDLNLSNSLVSIGESAFEGCNGFSGNLVIPNAVETIGNNAFKDCTGLGGTLTIGENATTVHGTAFTNSNFSTMNYNATNCVIGGLVWDQWYDNQYFANNSFSGMPLLETLNIGNNVESISLMAFKDCTTLTGTLTLPNSLTTIGEQAFYNCYGLEGIAMGNGVETIGAEAFRNCGGMRGELTLPETLQTVGNYAFASCDELTTITYNAVNCTEMGNAQQPVFYDCASVAHINIGENVASIPNYAFKRCSTVTDMTVAAAVPPTIGSSTFGTVSRSIPVTVQCGATPAFQAAQYWSEFTNYAENFNYVLQVAACDPAKGVVVVNKEANCDDPTAMVTAYPELGYAFTGWSENGTMVSEANPYTFLMESSRSLQAEFAPGVSYSVAVTLNPAVAGSVTGMGNYNDGSAVSLIATANLGYAFVNWTENGIVVSTEEEYSFTIHENHDFVANFTPYAYHWDVNIHQYSNNMTAIGIIQIEGVEQATPTLEIGAFCGDECRGRQLLTYYPQVNRYLVFLMLHGNDNDELRFKLYDHGLGEELELSCTSMVTFVTNGRLGTPANPYVFNFINSQQTEMSEGWTWYSTYIEQSAIEGLQMMTEGLGENGVIIKSQTGFIANSGGEWMGNLDAITNESMYMVNTTAATVLEMVGNSAIASQHPITLNQGWNWIGYPMATANDVNVALSGLDAHDNDMLKSQETFATYYEGFGWLGSLSTINPGMGLMYESNDSESVSFTYTEGRSGVLKKNRTAENNHWIPNMHKYTDNMNVMAVVELDDVELRDGRYELAVFAGEECRGSVRLMYVEPVDRYVAFLTITGHEPKDLRFALFDSDEGVEYGNAKEMIVFESDAVVGNTKDMLTIHFNSQSQSYGFDQVAVYPNPADCGQNFRIAMPVGYEQDVRVEVVNELGVVVSAVRSNALPMELKAPATPGVYMLKIVAEGHDVCIRKLIVR